MFIVMKEHVTQYNDTMLLSGTKIYQALVETISYTVQFWAAPDKN